MQQAAGREPPEDALAVVSVTFWRGVGGEFLASRAFPRRARASELKLEVGRAWAVPPRCQRLVVGAAELHDDEPLEAHCAGAGPALDVLVLVSLDLVRQGLAGQDPAHKAESLRALAALRRPCGQDVLAAVVGCLEEHCRHVRQFGQVQGQLEDHAGLVRQLAVEALGAISQPGEEMAVAALVARLQDHDYSVRKAAIRVLGEVVAPDHQGVVVAAAGLLGHAVYSTRVAALQVLSRVAARGNELAVHAACSSLDDRDVFVRLEALEVLPRLARSSDGRVAAQVRRKLADGDRQVRDAARAALGALGGADADG